jgi:transcriptional regulator with XRE-family HTH domain
MAKHQITTLEERALQDPDVRFGYDNYDLLRQLGGFVREMRTSNALSQKALEELSGVPQADISRLESGSMERGPTLLTLVRLAHAAGKRLVIGLQEPGAGEVAQGPGADAKNRDKGSQSLVQLISL